jgi:hypothetical protein
VSAVQFRPKPPDIFNVINNLAANPKTWDAAILLFGEQFGEQKQKNIFFRVTFNWQS